MRARQRRTGRRVRSRRASGVRCESGSQRTRDPPIVMTTLDQAAAAVASPNHPAANVVSLKWLLRKELWDHLHGKRLYLGGTMCIVLSLLAAFVRVHDYRQAPLRRHSLVHPLAPARAEPL